MRIKLPSDCQKIHVLFSGGMDSSLLLYLLAKEVKLGGKEIPIICHAFKKNIRPDLQRSIISKINDTFSLNIELRIHNGRFLIRQLTHLIQTTEPGYVFSGCNKVVEDKFIPTVYLPGDTPPVRGPAHNEKHVRPFIEIDKVGILQTYIEENILDLIPLTYSCGRSNIEPCNGCYFCLERKWAMDTLNITEVR